MRPNQRDYWAELSRSSKQAFEWAAESARKRSPSPSFAVDAQDLLIGVAKAHGRSSELYELFDYLGEEVDPFLDGFRAGGRPGVDELKRALPISELPPADSEVADILAHTPDENQRLGNTHNIDNVVRLKDLFGAIIRTDNQASSRLQNALNGAPIPWAILVASYADYLQTNERYHDFLARRHPFSAYSGYDSDRRAVKDLIGIGPEVNAMAYLIAAKSLRPPLAIGLFGDWGAGKSYFMEQLRKRIFKITRDVRLAGEPQRNIDIYKSIVQIDFNAWHYVEGNLWASLVEHIFSNLQWREGEKPDVLQRRTEELLKNLASAEGLAQQVRARRDSLERDLVDTRRRMTELAAERLVQLQSLEKAAARGALWLLQNYHKELATAVTKMSATGLFAHLHTALVALVESGATPEPALAAALETAATSSENARATLAQLAQSRLYRELLASLGKEQQDELAAAIEFLRLDQAFAALKADTQAELDELGIANTYEDAAELAGALQDLHATLQRGNLLVTSIQERGVGWTLAIIGVLLVGPAVTIILTAIPQDIPAVSTIMAGVAAFLTSLTVAVKSATSWLSRSIGRIEAVDEALDRGRQRSEEAYARRLAEIEEEKKRIETEYDQVKLAEQGIAERIAAIEREIQGLTPGSLLLEFIAERVGSNDYRQHLGVTALIRRDFEQLGELIGKYNEDLEKEGATEPMATATDRAAAGQPGSDVQAVEVGAEPAEGLLFNRIVLYIDDLDRCPPERVVDVLQAVHLLLAFELFVVVVAVDARWLAQSLHKHYDELLASVERDSRLRRAPNGTRQATPHDYLEKIFQIPFWIRPMSFEARRRMVQGLVAAPAGPTTVAAGEEMPHQAAGYSAEPRARPVDVEMRTESRPRSLEITALERSFMNELGAVLGETPRAVKRFVNVYRLVKAVALPYAPDFVADQDFADFKLVLLLLAIVTGMPAISRDFFLQLGRMQPAAKDTPTPAGAPQDGEAETEAAQFAVSPTTSLGEFMVGMRRVVLANHRSVDPAAEEAMHAGYPADARRDIERLRRWVNEYQQGKWQGLPLENLAVWIPQVARFSYRIEEF